MWFCVHEVHEESVCSCPPIKRRAVNPLLRSTGLWFKIRLPSSLPSSPPAQQRLVASAIIFLRPQVQELLTRLGFCCKTICSCSQAQPTQTQEWLTQPVVGGDISLVDLDADARKRARSGTSFETEGDSVIELDDVGRYDRSRRGKTTMPRP